MYEVGVLAALEEAFEAFSASDFDVVVGASSGACVATGLAGGLTATRMYRALLDPADDFFPFQRQHLMRIDLREVKRVSQATIGALRRMVSSVTTQPLGVDVWGELDRFWDSLPAGIFTTDAFEQFFFDFLSRRGVPKTFGEMPTQLLLVANDLDAGQRVVFGTGGDVENVPVVQAVCASIASPLLFAPVRIDGRDFVAGSVGETGHVDIAVQHGCDTVLVINAMVPVLVNPTQRGVPTGHGPMTRIRDKGMLWVYNQSWRLLSEARLQVGLNLYRSAHPDVTIHLVEPARDDATMFLHSPMNFAARRAILEDGFRSTIQMLRSEDSALRKSFEALGHQLKPRRASEPPE